MNPRFAKLRLMDWQGLVVQQFIWGKKNPGIISANNPLIRPAISWGGGIGGVSLDSHELYKMLVKKMTQKYLDPNGGWR